MCGIVGAVGPRAGEGLRNALSAIRHRGPDSEGIVEGKGWAMGIRRLAIIDVAGGDQPISNEDQTIWVVCNGEIYNHASLRSDLTARGHTFKTKSDVEVIVHLFEEYGEKFIDHLQGMFALFLATPTGCYVARDRLGIKPLYQMQTTEGIYFASEIRALLKLPGAPCPATDPSRVADYFLFRYVPEPRTAFVGIDRFPAGQITRLSAEGVTSRKYWQLQRPSPFIGSFEDAVAECEERLQRIVSMHLMSERPVGVFLSGGLDSSVLSALAARQAPHPIVLLTASFPGDDLDESSYAREVAEHLGAAHHVIRIDSLGLDEWYRAVDVVEDLVADPALVPLIALSRKACENLTVALLGEGSDETNLGYGGFLTLQTLLGRRRVSRYIPFAPRSGPWSYRLGLPGMDDPAFLARFTNVAIPADDYPPFLDPLPSAAERIREEVIRITSRDHLSLMEKNRLFRIEGWMKDDLLIKVDKTTMAASIEARVPFLDHTYVEWSFGIPDEYALRGGKTKAVLRAVASKLLPERIAARTQHGLVVPLQGFFASIGRDKLWHVLRNPEALWRSVFKEKPVLEILDRYKNGDSSLTFFIYQMVNAELWRERWLLRS
nr:asparagine synthase (glutamine-hydrolyzing) [Nitrospirota bacterium]